MVRRRAGRHHAAVANTSCCGATRRARCTRSRIAARIAARGFARLEPRRPARVLVSRRRSRRRRHRAASVPARRALPARRRARGEVAIRSKEARRDLPVVRRRRCMPSPRRSSCRRSSARRSMAQLPLHRALEMQLPLRDRERHGPDARRLSARGVALDGRRRQDRGHARAQDPDRAHVRKGRSARREFRLGRMRRDRRAVDAARDPLPPERRARRQLRHHRLRRRRSTRTTAASSSGASRKVQGWQRDVWRFLYQNRLEGLHWDVLEQDRFVLESMAPDAREHEFLYQHDIGMSRVRRLLHQRAQQQLAELDAHRARARRRAGRAGTAEHNDATAALRQARPGDRRGARPRRGFRRRRGGSRRARGARPTCSKKAARRRAADEQGKR